MQDLRQLKKVMASALNLKTKEEEVAKMSESRGGWSAIQSHLTLGFGLATAPDLRHHFLMASMFHMELD
jgi:hypothetical protein